MLQFLVDAFHRPFLVLMAPVMAASFLRSYSEMEAPAIATASVALLVLICFFAWVGKLLRGDPNESTGLALVFGLAAGILAVATAFWGEVANPFAVVLAVILAALKGPVYLKEKLDSNKEKTK